jgi:hypothetical protein
MGGQFDGQLSNYSSVLRRGLCMITHSQVLAKPLKGLDMVGDRKRAIGVSPMQCYVRQTPHQRRGGPSLDFCSVSIVIDLAPTSI